MKTRIFLIAGLVGTLLVSGGYGAFKDTGWGTRPASLGGAFTALADDANGALYNPAGIALIRERTGNFMYAKLYMGLDEVDLGLNYFSVVLPVVPEEKMGSLGISWGNFIVEHLYREDTFSITYADWLNNYLSKLPLEIAVGINLKYLRHSYTLDSRINHDAVFANGRAKASPTIDLGVLALPNFKYLPGFSAGFAMKNITQPDVGLKSKDIVPMEWRLGAGYNFGDLALKKMKFEQLTVAIDLSYRDRDLNYHFGIENYFLRRAIGVRLGANSREAAMGFGYTNKISNKLGITLDYAFIWPFFLEETNGSHRVSISIKF